MPAFNNFERQIFIFIALKVSAMSIAAVIGSVQICSRSVFVSSPFLSDFSSLQPGVVHPLQDEAVYQCRPLPSVQVCPAPGRVLLLLYDVILPSSVWSFSGSFPSPGLSFCTPLGPSVLFHSLWASSPFLVLFQNVFYRASYLRSSDPRAC